MHPIHLLPRLDSPRSSNRSISDISPTRSHGLRKSLRIFRIEFDRPGATYVPGEIITGNVIVDLTREKTVRALKLTVKGEANVHWNRRRRENNVQENRHTKTDHFWGQEQYFNVTYVLLGDTASGEVRIPSGYNKYSFRLLLPQNIPCSFEHPIGHIRYTTKAVIDRPWKFNHECKIAFTVITSYDLNDYSQQCIGIDDEESKSFHYCCLNQGSIKMCVKLPTTGFVPGQSVQTMINFENMSSVNMTQICVKLQRTLVFHATKPCRKSRTDREIIKVEQNTGPFNQLSNIVSQLQIPPIPPSQLEHCGVIDQSYAVRITVHISGMHRNITKVYPILIGTIPLRLIVPSAPYQQDIPQPTAPMIEYDNDPPPPMPTSPDKPSTSTDQWDIPPPSYEECMQRANSIKEQDESDYVQGADQPFAPRYPVFNFPTSHPPRN